MVGVKEGQLQSPGELAPDGGFAGAGQTYKTDHGRVSNGTVLNEVVFPAASFATK